jgi:hypothetical protein
MLDCSSPEYLSLIGNIKRSKNITRNYSNIRLPSVCLTLDPKEWFVENIWRIENEDRISYSVFNSLGSRTRIIPLIPGEDSVPVRGFFCISKRPIKFEDLFWPGDQTPLIFHSVCAKQLITHYHACFIMPYMCKSVNSASEAFHFKQRGIYCERIRTTYEKTYNYIKNQSILPVYKNIRKNVAFNYIDHIRYDRDKAKEIDYETYGLPRFWNETGFRKNDTTKNLTMVSIYSDVEHIDQSEIFLLLPNLQNLHEYRGEAVVVTCQSNFNSIPRQAGFAIFDDTVFYESLSDINVI